MNEEGFAGTCGTNHENVGFLKVDAVIGRRKRNALVVVVDGDGEGFFSVVLPDNELVESGEDFLRFGESGGGIGGFGMKFAGDYVGTDLSALVADIGAVVALNEAVDLTVGFAAKRTMRNGRPWQNPSSLRELSAGNNVANEPAENFAETGNDVAKSNAAAEKSCVAAAANGIGDAEFTAEKIVQNISRAEFNAGSILGIKRGK